MLVRVFQEHFPIDEDSLRPKKGKELGADSLPCLHLRRHKWKCLHLIPWTAV